ncbi:PLAC8 motif-containing protein [Tanacetum coccineum]
MKPSTVPPPQYVTGIPAQHMPATNKWSTGLFDCTEDMSSCKSKTYIVDRHPGITFSTRELLLVMQEYMFREQPCNDVFVHCCCEFCALCQEYRELKNRGFEPSLGWEGNLVMQNQGVVMPPVGPGEMKR